MAKHVLQRPGTPYNRLRRSQRFNPGVIIEPIPVKHNHNFALKEQARIASVQALEAPAGSGSFYPADNNTGNENVNGKQRTAAAIGEVRGVEECVRKTRNRRNSANFAGKDFNKARKRAIPSYLINTRSTQRSDIAISTSDSISSYYTSLLNEELVIPINTNKKRREKPSQTVTKLLQNNQGKLKTGRLKKVAKRRLKHKQANSTSERKRVLFEAVLAYESNTADKSSTSEEITETEEEQAVPLVSRKSFFERSVQGFCKRYPAFDKATERCLNRLTSLQSIVPMNSPASPTAPAPAMLTVSSYQQLQHISPTTVILAQTTSTTQSGKRKHSDDAHTIDHSYPITIQQSITPPGHLSTRHQHLPGQQQGVGNQFQLSPRSWIFQTPDKQKQCKLPPPSAVCDEADDGPGQTLVVPVLMHHSKRLKTVYSFDESTVVDLVQGGGGAGALMEVQIDSDRLAPICQITTADDGADCEFETSSIGANLSSTNSSVATITNSLAAEELNQFQLQTHELSLDFSASSSTAGRRQHILSGDDGEGEGAFLDQWVRMNTGGSGDHSPLRLLQQHYPTSGGSARHAAPIAMGTIHQHLRAIHNVATQRPTKTLPRCGRRQYLERKSLTFEENSTSAGASPQCVETPKGGDTTGSGRLRAFKQKAASVDSIGGGVGLGSARKRSMDLFNAGRGETIRDLREISETITSGAYEREFAGVSHEQENVMPPSRMRLLLGNLQMNDSVDINYDRPLYPRRNY